MTTTVTFHVGDVRDVMASMPDASVDLVVTSPILIDINEANVPLARARLAESMLIRSEHVDGDTTTWTVDAALPPGGHANPQLSIFDEVTA